MADNLYGFTAADVTVDVAGNVLPDREAVCYTAFQGGDIFTDTKAVNPDLSVGSTTGGVVTADSEGRVRFFAADTYETLWLDWGTGTRWPVNPLSYAAALEAGLEAATDAVPGLVADEVAALVPAMLGVVALNVGDFATNPDQLTGAADAGPAFQSCIDALPEGGRLVCPPGSVFEFTGSTVVRLKSNIEIDLRGSTITKSTGAGTYCIFVGLSDGATGYGSGPSNVTIRNGTFIGDLDNGGSLCVLAGHHMQKVRIYDCEIITANVSGHTFDFGGCDDVLIQGCVWRGCKPWPDGAPGRPETIQVDQSLVGALSYADAAGSYDGLLTRNVTVTDCRFLPYDDGVTVWPAPVPMGAHGQREGQWYENITVRNVYVEDPVKDLTGGTATGADDIYIRGLFHFPTVKGLHISNVRVVAKDGLGSVRAVMVSGRTSGTLASGDPNVSSAAGVWAVPQGSHDITIEGLHVTGMLNSGSSTNPIVNIVGVTGANIENVRVSLSVDGVYREAVLMYKVNDATVEFVKCKNADSGARLVQCQNVAVSGRFTNVNLPVRLDATTQAAIGPCVDVRSTTENAFVIITNSANYVTCTNIQAPNRTWLYGASGVEVKPTNRAQAAIIGAAVSA